jgi:glycosyltransferase involved in cell wall biosynthesis
MKVALISFRFGPAGGGAAITATQLTSGLDQRGIEVVEIVSQRDKRPGIIQKGRVKTYSFFPRNLYWVGDKSQYGGLRKVLFQLIDIWNPHVYRTVHAILRKEQPDIVHVMKLRGLSPSVWSAAAAAGCRPLIQTCHDYEIMSPDGILLSRAGQWASEGKWILRPYQWLRANLSRHVDVATSPSRYTLTTLTDRGFFSQAHHIVVPNSHGYSLARLDGYQTESSVRSLPAADDHFRLLYLGRLETAKGVDLLCAAVDRLAYTQPNLRLEIVGWGNIESLLQQEYGNHPNICFHGGVFGTEKESLLANADMLVVPSVWPEVFGMVIIESYAFGKPVIASRIGGIPELVQESETGFLVEPGDVTSLQRIIEYAFKNRHLVAEMRRACFAAARRYSLEDVTEQYLEAYEIGLGRRSRL